MVSIFEHNKHFKNLMEGKTPNISNLIEEKYEEELYVNKLGVYNHRNPIKSPPFYVSMKIMDKITHCCLVDGDLVLILCLK
jgi:hypothetical protein